MSPHVWIINEVIEVLHEAFPFPALKRILSDQLDKLTDGSDEASYINSAVNIIAILSPKLTPELRGTIHNPTKQEGLVNSKLVRRAKEHSCGEI